jgi:hypothetical protein
MRIYISGSFVAQQRLRPIAEALRLKGHEIISSWLNEATQPEHLGEDDWQRRLGYKDVAEVFASDCLILDLDEVSTTGGRYVEWGVACHPLSMIKRYTVGVNRAGCFNQLADAHFDSWAELLEVFPEA